MENAYQYVMVYRIKIGMDIHFYKPSDAGEVNFNLAKSCLIASVRTEAMVGISEGIFVNTLQHYFHDLLYQFIVVVLNDKWTELPVLFGDIGMPAGRTSG